MKKLITLFVAILLLSVSALAQGTTADPEAAKFVTSDIELFWKAYDKARPDNNLNVFRDEYLRQGSAGLKDFTKMRIRDTCALVGQIEAVPKYYAALREPSLKVASYEPQMRASYRKMKELYPAAVFPNVYFVIGRLSTAGTVSSNGLLIGVDMFGRNEGVALDNMTNWHKSVLAPTDRLPYIVAHELVHFEQKFTGNDGEWTLLGKALNEGGADFVGQLISGANINPHLHEYGDPREKELWEEFRKEMNGKDASNWLYQGDAAKNRPADLGYYIGYKICESYYKKAADKKQAVKDILEIKDFNKFLADSGYDGK